MKVISIDPGYDRLGVAVLEKTGSSKEAILFSECVHSDRESSFEERLFSIVSTFKETINKFSPDELAIEKLFFQNNQKTAMDVSKVIGALEFVAMENKMPVFEYTPLQIKTAITGNGRSTKTEMMKMIPLIIENPKNGSDKKMLDDEYDAIAVGLTHLAIKKTRDL
ncbi:MAG: crossover junction endodeoxyribonuclease RuvC [Candidatus Campbellbacteria bacterium]|nr:crossover junction endodeoxyribonuclease RuvC [Candidatus Campbellbacteria bacterium]